jgi:polysaccharide pyruvyl transferase WcaK-like protein
VRVLNTCDYISLRDPDSVRFLTELGVDASLLHLGGDPALLLPTPPSTRYPAILHAHRLNFPGERMCVVLRGVPDNLLQSVIVAARLLCQRRGMQAMLVCFCKGDEEAIRSVAGEEWAVRIRARGVEDLSALVAGASAVLSMRLHALVLASLHATPAIGIVTDPDDSKILSFTKGVGQDAILYPKPSVAELVAFAEFHLWGEGAQNPRLLTAAVEEMQKKARKDLANIVGMLYNEEEKETHGK